jgi:hypothetical protein
MVSVGALFFLSKLQEFINLVIEKLSSSLVGFAHCFSNLPIRRTLAFEDSSAPELRKEPIHNRMECVVFGSVSEGAAGEVNRCPLIPDDIGINGTWVDVVRLSAGTCQRTDDRLIGAYDRSPHGLHESHPTGHSALNPRHGRESAHCRATSQDDRIACGGFKQKHGNARSRDINAESYVPQSRTNAANTDAPDSKMPRRVHHVHRVCMRIEVYAHRLRLWALERTRVVSGERDLAWREQRHPCDQKGMDEQAHHKAQVRGGGGRDSQTRQLCRSRAARWPGLRPQATRRCAARRRRVSRWPCCLSP